MTGERSACNIQNARKSGLNRRGSRECTALWRALAGQGHQQCTRHRSDAEICKQRSQNCQTCTLPLMYPSTLLARVGPVGTLLQPGRTSYWDIQL